MSADTLPRTIDVTGLSEDAIATVEKLVGLLRQQGGPAQSPSPAYTSYDEWSRALHAWAASHSHSAVVLDDSRESIYEGCGE